MSEFACVNGHLMSSAQHFCQVCGKPVHTMDGKTHNQLIAEEKHVEKENQKDET